MAVIEILDGKVRIAMGEKGREGVFHLHSELHESGTDPSAKFYNISMDAVEAVILGHATAGVDVTTKEYQEGIRSAIDAIAQHCPEADDDH